MDTHHRLPTAGAPVDAGQVEGQEGGRKPGLSFHSKGTVLWEWEAGSRFSTLCWGGGRGEGANVHPTDSTQAWGPCQPLRLG